MSCELQWTVNRSCSCFHAAAALMAGRELTSPAVDAAVGETSEQLQALLDAHRVPRERFFRFLLPLPTLTQSARAQALRALDRTVGPGRAPGLDEKVVELLGQMTAAYGEALPSVVDDVTLRGGPLRELWEARGPGLLSTVGRLTEPVLVPERANVLLVDPVLGGAGAAHPANNAVSIEAVLANPLAELPETVRLGWLLAQLEGEVPRHFEPLEPGRGADLTALAMIPATLAAAETVEWVGDSRRALPVAIEAWLPTRLAGTIAADRLAAWWETYSAGRPAWNVALMALDQMADPSNA
ncbi:MAG: hypothetical protein JSS27_13690 [Planctomycetes bacterium]|nr:hypothetical protein [Planctomycetota bacterium]